MRIWRALKKHPWLLLVVMGLFGLTVAFAAPLAPKGSKTPQQTPKNVEMPVPAPLPTELGEEIEEADIYGVVLKVRNAGPAPDSGQKLSVNPEGQAHMALPTDTLQKVTVRLDLNRPIPGLKGSIITVDNILGENPAYNIPLKPGARVLLSMERNLKTGQLNFYIANRDRTPALMILGAVTILALLLIGGVEVSKHILLATLILLGCYQLLFPAVVAGQGGHLATLMMCFCFTVLGSLIYKSPENLYPERLFSRTQTTVILSTLGGLAIMAIIMRIMQWITPLNGFTSEALAALWYRSARMDYWALFMGTVLLGYQGFIFYLCWSLAQTRKKPGSEEEEPLSFWERFNIAMLRGRHHLGPLLSSLGLLFLGLYLPILLQLQGTSTAQFINLESTASMIIIAFAGGLTLVLTVPLTAVISAWVYSLPNTGKQPKTEH
jgi:uncharacterized membrane protein